MTATIDTLHAGAQRSSERSFEPLAAFAVETAWAVAVDRAKRRAAISTRRPAPTRDGASPPLPLPLNARGR